MDYTKMLTAAGVEAIVLLAIFMFVLGILAGMLPAWIVPITATLTLPYFLSLMVAVLIKNYVIKNFLKGYVKI